MWYFAFSAGNTGLISDDFQDFGRRLRQALASFKGLWTAVAIKAPDIDTAEQEFRAMLAGHAPTLETAHVEV